MNQKKVRGDFPQLNKGFIYFDSAATALKPRPVIDAVMDYNENLSANIERGLHRPSHLATIAYEEAHHKLKEFLHGEGEVVFTKNCTEAINLVANGIEWHPGDRIVTTVLEHNSNLLPWFRLRDKGIEVVVLKCNKEGEINLDEFSDAINEKTRLVAFGHASNVLGTIQPVDKLTDIAKKKGAMVLIDGAQAAPHLKIDLDAIGCDFYAASGHKMLGPSGTGFLFINNNAMDYLNPCLLGGGTVSDVTLEGFILAEGWEKYEAGTPNISGGIGLGAAVDYLKKIGMDEVRNHEMELTGYLIERLIPLDGLRVHGPRDPARKTGVISFSVRDIPSHRIAIALDEIGHIAVRSGFHCAFILVRDILGEEKGTVRASFYIYNTKAEIDEFIDVLKEII